MLVSTPSAKNFVSTRSPFCLNPYPKREQINSAYSASQLHYSPVLFITELDNMALCGVECFLKVDPGKVLTGLVKPQRKMPGI